MKETRHDDLSPDDEALVQRLVEHGVDPADAESDPRLRRILELQRRLDEVGISGANGAAALGPGTGSGAAEQRVEELVRRTLGSREPQVPVARFRLLSGPVSVLVGLAALALIAASLWFVFGGSGGLRTLGPGEDMTLGGRTDVEVRMSETDDGVVELVWDVQVRLGAEYSVRVYSADPVAGGVELAASEGLDEPRWRPADDHVPGETPVSAWPQTVWIVIEELRTTATRLDRLVDQPLER